MKRITALLSKNFLPPLAIFLVLVAIKIAQSSTIWGPMIFDDETMYKSYAKLLFTYGSYFDTHYPFLYPLTLSPSFFFGTDHYRVMLIINAVLSSTLIIPVWFISRLFLDKISSCFVIVIAGIVPFHFYFSTLLMSENLYLPLLMLTIYVILARNDNYPVLWALLTGLLLGSLHLARHMSLAITPILVIAWWLKPVNGVDNKILSAKKRQYFLIICFAAIIVYLPWLKMNLFFDPIIEIVGSKFLYPAYREFELFSMIQFVLLSICNIIIQAGPVLPLLFCSIIFFNLDYTALYNRFMFIVFGISMIMLLAVSRHHWRAPYNIENPDHFQGRYFIYLNILFLLLGFITVKRQSEHPVKFKQTLIIHVGSLLLFAAAYWLVIERSIWNLPSHFYMNHIAPTGFMYNSMGIVSLLLILGISFISVVLLYRFKKARMTAFFISLFIFYIWGGISYFSSPNFVDRFHANHTGRLVSQINQLKLKPARIYVDNNIKYVTVEKKHFEFWEFQAEDYSITRIDSERDRLDNKEGVLLSRRVLEGKKNVLLDSYILDGKGFRIYLLPIQ